MNNPKVILKQQLNTGIAYLSTLARLVEEQDPQLFSYQPTPASRQLGEIFLHLIRSLEYYLTGVATTTWIPSPYKIDKFGSIQQVKELLSRITPHLKELIDSLDGDKLHHLFTQFDNPAFGLNLMIELLYHQSHHIGQIQVYLRQHDIEPPAYHFLV